MSKTDLAVIGAGPYGLSVAAHAGHHRIDHRIFGKPMQFWSQIAKGGDERYLKSYCFATNLSAPIAGSTFADFNVPRGMPTYEPCSMANFTNYGRWFQQRNVPWCEPVDVTRVTKQSDGFSLTLASGERLTAARVVISTGLANFAKVSSVLRPLPAELLSHTSQIDDFQAFKGLRVAIVGAGQSALEAAALLHEAGAFPRLLVREDRVLWHSQIPEHGRSLWKQIRSPKSNLGYGPKNWVISSFPSIMQRMPETWRNRLVQGHLPPEGAWWLRPRVENIVPVDVETTVVEARQVGGRAILTVHSAKDGARRQMEFDHVVAGTGYDMNIERLPFLDSRLCASVDKVQGSPRLNSHFETSVPGLHFVGPLSAMSFGPLFRFVAGAEYSAQTVSASLVTKASRAAVPMKVSSAA